MAAIRYVGKKVDYKGRRLFDILCNLKNLGAGRIVVKSEQERLYPELCYYKIIKAEPEMDKYNSRGNVWVEQVFRGYKYPEVILCQKIDQADFRLIPREDEHKYTKAEHKIPLEEILPAQVYFPPLLRHLITQEMIRKGQEVSDKDLKMTMVYNDITEPWRVRPNREGEKSNINMDEFPDLPFYRPLKISDEKVGNGKTT